MSRVWSRANDADRRVPAVLSLRQLRRDGPRAAGTSACSARTLTSCARRSRHVSPPPDGASTPPARLRAGSLSTLREHGSCGAARSSVRETTTSLLGRVPFADTSSRGRRRIRGCVDCGFAERVFAPCAERNANRAASGPAGPPLVTRVLRGASTHARADRRGKSGPRALSAAEKRLGHGPARRWCSGGGGGLPRSSESRGSGPWRPGPTPSSPSKGLPRVRAR